VQRKKCARFKKKEKKTQEGVDGKKRLRGGGVGWGGDTEELPLRNFALSQELVGERGKC